MNRRTSIDDLPYKYNRPDPYLPTRTALRAMTALTHITSDRIATPPFPLTDEMSTLGMIAKSIQSLRLLPSAAWSASRHLPG